MVPDRRSAPGRAFVVLRRGVAPASGEELVAWCRERLANFKVPRSVVVLAELPKGATGKVAKDTLREPATP